jgi:pilus biogenesis lipoprotein CpaD
MISIRQRLAPTLLLAAILLSVCRTNALAEPRVITVEPTTHMLLLKIRPGGQLPRDEAERLVDFLMVASGGRLDAIHIVVAGYHPAARHAVTRIMYRAGVAPNKVREMAEVADPSFRFGVRVIATRYTAHAPDCPPLEFRASGDSNDFEPSLGCSSDANLAATVNDPKDLVDNNAVPPADGARAALSVRKYRSGNTSEPAARPAASPTTSVGASSP